MSLHPVEALKNRIKKASLVTDPSLRDLYREREHIEFFKHSPLVCGVTQFRFKERVKQINRILEDAVMVTLIVLVMATTVRADTIASYYTRESCAREGTSGVMANNRRLDDAAFTCASWDYVLGSTLLVTSSDRKRRVVVTVSDRGPNEKCYKKGVTVDLTRVAFARVGQLKQGHAKVNVQLISGKRMPPKVWRKR